jgi:chromosome segregation ATPase
MNTVDIQTLITRMDDVKSRLSLLTDEASRLQTFDTQLQRKDEILRQKETALIADQNKAKTAQQDNHALRIRLDQEWAKIDAERTKLEAMADGLKHDKTTHAAEVSQYKRDLEIREQKLLTLEHDREVLDREKKELNEQKILITKERQLFDTRMATIDSLEKRLTERLARVNNMLKE